MNSKSIWLWIWVAAGLFGLILVKQRFETGTPTQRALVLPNTWATNIVKLQIRPRNQLEIRAERTNATWVLTAPLHYPAQPSSVEALLTALEQLTPAAQLSEAEFRSKANGDEEFGFKNPQATITIEEAGHRSQILLVGATTAPGDQVFVRLVGDQGVNVVDAALLKVIPASANEWRDRTLVHLDRLAYNRLAVTNGPKAFELQRQATNGLWRMLSPIDARADQSKLEELLQSLAGLRAEKFVTDEPQADLESYGLQPAELQLVFKRDTNALAVLQFGKSPSNDLGQVYARRLGLNGVVTVSKSLLEAWRGSVNDFRDSHLVTSTGEVDSIEVRGEDNFVLQKEGTNGWRVLPQNFAADPELVRGLLVTLSSVRIVEFTKDVVTPMDFATYGLASPSRRYVLKTANTSTTNTTLVDLEFGTNQNDQVFVRRADEPSVYAVRAGDVAGLPAAACQFRDRRVWDFSEGELAGVTIRQRGQVRQYLRKEAHDWALAPGSQGTINPLAIEESVRPLCHLLAHAWVTKGDQARARYGFSENGHQLELDLKNGEKRTIEFGGPSPSQSVYASVKLDGEVWIFEFPPSLYRFVSTYLTIPVSAAQSPGSRPASGRASDEPWGRDVLFSCDDPGPGFQLMGRGRGC